MFESEESKVYVTIILVTIFITATVLAWHGTLTGAQYFGLGIAVIAGGAMLAVIQLIAKIRMMLVLPRREEEEEIWQEARSLPRRPQE